MSILDISKFVILYKNSLFTLVLINSKINICLLISYKKCEFIKNSNSNENIFIF